MAECFSSIDFCVERCLTGLKTAFVTKMLSNVLRGDCTILETAVGSSSPHASPQVLVLDDGVEPRKRLPRYVQEQGFVCSSPPNARECTSELLPAQIHLIVLDAI